MDRRVFAAWVCLGLAGQVPASGATEALSPWGEPVSLAPEADRALHLRTPGGVEDLRQIERQLQRVVAQVMPATANVQIGRGVGSGVVVSKEGLVLCAAHVVGRSGRQAWVTLSHGRRFAARTLGTNHELDAGMLLLDHPPADLPFVPLAPRDFLDPGEWVVTIGQPGGIVPGRDPPVRFGRVLFQNDQVICTDCKLVGGDSGGPLFNMRGEVVGIHSSIGPSLNHNFHVPLAAFRSSWDRLQAGENWGGPFDRPPGRPTIGVRGREQDGRILITEAMPGRAAARAGLRSGDVVTAVDGKAIVRFDELAQGIDAARREGSVRLTVDRNGETIVFEVEIERSRRRRDEP